MTTEKIRERLLTLEQEGRLSPAVVLADARDPASPLHDQFEWDDSAAAEKFRLVQASRLIVRLKIDVTVHSVPLRAPAYVRDVEGGGFVSMARVRTQPDAARAVIVDEMTRVSNAVRRAKTVAAALGFTDEIERIEALAASLAARAAVISDQPKGVA